MMRYILLMMGMLLFYSCNKTPMKGSLGIFVGTWQWDRTMWYDNGYPAQQHFLYASNDSNEYKVKVTSKGEMYWYVDDIQTNRINLKIVGNSCEDDWAFNCICGVELKNNAPINGFNYNNCDGDEELWLDAGFPIDISEYNEKSIFRKIE